MKLLLVLSMLNSLALAADWPRIMYPPTRKEDVVDDYHGTKIADPYRWLEDDNAAETKAWVVEQNRVTSAFLASIPRREQIRERLAKLWNYERFSEPFERGGRYFWTYNSGLQNQRVLYTADSLDAAPRVLLDPNTLSADGTVSLKDTAPNEDGTLLATSDYDVRKKPKVDFDSATYETKPFDAAGPNTNGLGMRFVPVPEAKVKFAIYQTRVKDYQAFIRETGYVHMRETADPDSRMWSLDRDGRKQRGHSWEDPGFKLKQTPDRPVVGVSWDDARAFCEWLTMRERAAGRLPADWAYRLPTDAEWSLAVGLVEEDLAKTPEQKDGKIKDKYPWGNGWPPPAGAGNYAGTEADDGHWPANFPIIEGYNDGFARTAPVGSFKPNRHGIYDLGSNVSEWCQDTYKAEGKNRVMRGASWLRDGRNMLLSSFRFDLPPGCRFDNVGFRCVAGLSSPLR